MSHEHLHSISTTSSTCSSGDIHASHLGQSKATTSSGIKAVQKALSNSRWRHIFLRSISMDSAL